MTPMVIRLNRRTSESLVQNGREEIKLKSKITWLLTHHVLVSTLPMKYKARSANPARRMSTQTRNMAKYGTQQKRRNLHGEVDFTVI